MKNVMKRNKVYNVSQFLPTQNFEEFSLQRLMKPIIFVAQCFALLPLTGISKSVERLKFEWISLRTFYTFFTIIIQFLLALITLIDLFRNLKNFFGLVGIIWWVRSVIGSIIFVKIAYKWPILLRRWTKMEAEMLSYGPPQQLRKKFRFISLLYLIIGVGEHFLYIYGTSRYILSTMNENENFFEKYFVFYEGFFNYFSYHIFYGVLIKFINLTSTFMWQFCDLFIILLSTALTERFHQINTVIKTNHNLTELQWRDIRKQYNTLALLCKTLNSILAEAIVLSFFGNVYFFSITIFQSLSPKTITEATFIWYSIGFYCIHIAFLCLYVAGVYEESVASLPEISSLSVRNLSHEVRVDRLSNQMAARDIALTGSGLFKIRRSLMLNIAGVIVTLQLIFAQFHAQFHSKMA